MRLPPPKKRPKPERAELIDPQRDWEPYAHPAAIGLLMILGALYAAMFFGHFVFPNSDFCSFLEIGKAWIHFELPYTMKRGPIFSIITATVGLPFNRSDQYLFGAELYNACLLPLAMVLIYLIGRKAIGNAAVWVALLCGITPWMVRLTSEPLAELTIVTLTAATILCARSHLRWAFVFAMLTSITRWDLVAIIPAIAIVDILQHRKWTKTILLSAAAMIPFGIFMLITRWQLAGQPAGGAHYLQVLATDHKFELLADLNLYVQTVGSFFNAMLLQDQGGGRVIAWAGANHFVFWAGAVAIVTTFIAGTALAIARRRWEILTMLITAVPYVLVHSIYPYRLPRFCIPAAWMILFICAYGAIAGWDWLDSKYKVGRFNVVAQILLIAILFLWLIKLLDTFSFARRNCPAVYVLAIASCLITVAGFFVLQVLRRTKLSLAYGVMPLFLVMAVTSNAITTGFTMGDGKTDANFKTLSIWFLENAEKDDKLVTTMPGFLPIYTGLPQERFIHINSIAVKDANNFETFVHECQKRGITYIAWDSRLAGNRNDLYYKLWGLDRIEILGAPFLGKKVSTIGQCQLVKVLHEGNPKIAVYRVTPATLQK